MFAVFAVFAMFAISHAALSFAPSSIICISEPVSIADSKPECLNDLKTKLYHKNQGRENEHFMKHDMHGHRLRATDHLYTSICEASNATANITQESVRLLKSYIDYIYIPDISASITIQQTFSLPAVPVDGRAVGYWCFGR